MKNASLCFLLALFSFNAGSFAQGVQIGAWRHHLPSGKIIKSIEVGDEIYGASEFGLVVYNKSENSISKFNKVHGLSDFGLSALSYFEEQDIIFVGYQNGNIDLIKSGLVYNVPDINQTSSILGSKTINNAIIHDDKIYVATDFGIVQISIEHFVVLNTFFIGENASHLRINDLIIYDNYFYAATQSGVLKAEADSPNLSDYNVWSKLENVPVEDGDYQGICIAFDKMVLWNRAGDMDQIFFLEDEIWQLLMPEGDSYLEPKKGIGFSNNKLWVANEQKLDFFNEDFELSESIEEYNTANPAPNHAFFGDEGVLWISDSNIGIVRKKTNGEFQNFMPEGPLTASSTGLGAAEGVVWVAPGGVSDGGVNTFDYNGVFFFENEKWRYANRFNVDLMTGVFDIIGITPDPGNNKQAYVSSWSEGLLRINTEREAVLYDENNSTLQRRAGLNDRIRIGGAAFDSNRNLWVTNSEVDKPVSVMKNNGEWLAFSTKGLVSNNQLLGKIAVDNNDQKWIILPGDGILILKENTLEGSNDFQVRKLSTQQGNGSLPSNYVFSIAVDQSGYVWVGTQNGIAVFYSPHTAFTSEAFDAQQIIVEQDGFAGLLLENDRVNSITIDGGNNKWFGTSRSGAFFMTEDAKNTYHHFTTLDSPLPSNNIYDIAVEPATGEVFFATDKGLASFRNWATAGGEKHEDVYAYPNPVKPGYDGYIAIKGLVRNADIRITDINGHLVYKTTAQGGQAIWNGRDLSGNKPASGVYVVFSTNDDGTETAVTKILFFN